MPHATPSIKGSTHNAAEPVLMQEDDLFLNGPVVLFDWNNTQGFPVCNVTRNVGALLGMSAESLVQRKRPFLDLIHPEDRPHFMARLEAAGKTGTPRQESDAYRLFRPDGGVTWVIDHIRPILDADGRATRFHGYLLDVSRELARMDQLRLWASVFLYSHEGIIVTDTSGQILDVNSAYCRMSGYEREELLGANPRILNSNEHDASFFAEMWQQLFKLDTWQGELLNRKKTGELFLQKLTISAVRDNRDQVTHFIGLAHDITARRESERKLAHMAYFDNLTGLPNRALLSERLGQAISRSTRSGATLAVCYLDIDGFKQVNDQWGHATGDLLLKQVATRLQTSVRAGDTVARLGGDEFVLLMAGLKDIDECDLTLKRILAELRRPFELEPACARVSGSIGVAFYPQDGDQTDILLRHADQALYAAKTDGRNRYQLFDTTQDRLARAYREAIREIDRGLKEGQFRLLYQPIVNLREGVPVSVVTHVCWQHPERGLLPASEFMGTVDDGPISIPMGRWLLASVLEQVCAWHAEGLDIRISLNVSLRYLQSPDFLDELKTALARHPACTAKLLELAILESTAATDLAKLARIMEGCSSLGVAFAIDDFGSGYSSLAYLRHLPAEALHINPSFVSDMLTDPDDISLVQGVLGLAQSFHMQVLAKAVSTTEQGLLLMQLGCDFAQGDCIAKAIPASEIPVWWRHWQSPQLWRDNAPLHYALEDIPLLTVEVKFRHWIDALCNWLTAPGEFAEPPNLSPDRCRFGRWAKQVGSRQHADAPVFVAALRAHQALHETADRLYQDQRQHPKADLAGATTLRQVAEHMLNTLRGLQQHVALNRGHEADAVNDKISGDFGDDAGNCSEFPLYFRAELPKTPFSSPSEEKQ